MTTSVALPFDLPDEARASLGSLTAQQRGQLDAALTYHSLRNPGARIAYRVSVGDIAQMPALTDLSTVLGPGVPDEALFARFEATSTAVGIGPAGNSMAPLVRHLRLSHADATPATVQPPGRLSAPRQVYRALEKRTPVLLDAAREAIVRFRQHGSSQRVQRYSPLTPDNDIEQAIERWDRSPAAPPADARPAILFGLHWLQTGGAERWAVESIQIAKDAGFLPVVVTDQNSVHPWITRPELEGCVVVTLSFSEQEHTLDLGLAHALLENYDLRGAVLHHASWLYHCLPWIKQQRPEMPIVDSLHIVEYLGGGYPGTSVHFDEYIDIHHVISPQLVEWLTEVQGVAPEKVRLAPLTRLTTDHLSTDEMQHFAPRDPAAPFTIAYVGRLSRQKRPDMFLALVHRLRKRGLNFHAIMHGDGEMRDVVNGLIDQFSLRGVVEQRFEETPVPETLDDADLLVVTSINEGLTLTTFEALAAGIPVLSTDVGSQRSVVEGDMLVPRSAQRFLPLAVSQITALSASEQLREQAWNTQKQRMDEFAATIDADHFMKELFTQWQE